MNTGSIARRAFGALAVVVVALVVAWYAGFTLRARTAGAIGNDPATYTQMAIDLAERGLPARAFPLFELLRDDGLSWYAFLPIGYRVPEGGGLAAPIFAFGAPALWALAWRLAGESGIYALTPLLGAASLVVLFLLAGHALAAVSGVRRAVVAALAVALLATTPKQMALALVPMSDVPAQLAVALAALLALMAEGRRPWPARLLWLAAGLSLGMAYLIRHSMLIALIPLLWLALSQAPAGGSAQRRPAVICLAAGMAGLMLPDLIFHAMYLEGLWAVESLESTVWGGRYVLPNLLSMALDLASWRGFGPLAVLAVPGVGVVWRWAGRRMAITLLVWWLALAGAHAPLALTGVFENTLRYILPAYPPLVVFMAAGCWALAEQGARRLRRLVVALRQPGGRALSPGAVARAVVWGIALLCVVGALGFALRGLVRPPDPRYIYGWIGPATRADLLALADRLPPNAVIGANDQMAGALFLYARRDVFRPAAFVAPAEEFPRFVERMRQAGRPVFALGNLGCLADEPDDQRLPAWIQRYAWRDTGLMVRALPFACEQRLYQTAD